MRCQASLDRALPLSFAHRAAAIEQAQPQRRFDGQHGKTAHILGSAKTVAAVDAAKRPLRLVDPLTTDEPAVLILDWERLRTVKAFSVPPNVTCSPLPSCVPQRSQESWARFPRWRAASARAFVLFVLNGAEDALSLREGRFLCPHLPASDTAIVDACRAACKDLADMPGAPGSSASTGGARKPSVKRWHPAGILRRGVIRAGLRLASGGCSQSSVGRTPF